MKIAWIGQIDGITATGEDPDVKHMARCLAETGTEVTTIDQAEVKANFDGKKENNIPDGEYDIILLTKWHHYSEDLIKWIKEKYKGKLVYILWDWMGKTGEFPGWHEMILKNCDLYLSGELGMLPYFHNHSIPFQYFNFDTADGQYDQLPRDEKYDVVFTGSYIEKSYRTNMLRKVSSNFDTTIFSHDHETWKKNGFKAEPGKYDANFNQISAQARVMLVMNWPEPSAETMGYQSNRIGKIITTGGMPLVHYFPMADRLLGDNVMFFYKEEDLMEKIKWLLDNPPQRETARVKAYDFGRRAYTTQVRMRELRIILESL